MSISSADVPGPFHPEMPFDPIDAHVGAFLASDTAMQAPGENPVAIIHIGNVRNLDLARSVWAIQRREASADPNRTNIHMLRLDTYLRGPMPTTPDGQHIVAERILISGDSITLDREIAAAGDDELVIPRSDIQEALSAARTLTPQERKNLISNTLTERYKEHVPEGWDMGAVRGLMVESEAIKRLAKEVKGRRAGGLLGRWRRNNQ